MDDSPRPDHAPQTLSGELRHVQHHLACLHQQSALMLRMMSALLNKLNELSTKEEGIGHGIDTIENEISQLIGTAPATSSCPSCGGPLDHHRAASGELHVCTSCGFSRFVDGHGVIRSASQPATFPATGDGAAPPSWVG